MVAEPQMMPAVPEWMDQKSRDRGAVNINDIYWKRSDREENAGWILIGPSAEQGPDGRPLTRQAESWLRKGRTPLLEAHPAHRVQLHQPHLPEWRPPYDRDRKGSTQH